MLTLGSLSQCHGKAGCTWDKRLDFFICVKSESCSYTCVDFFNSLTIDWIHRGPESPTQGAAKPFYDPVPCN